MTAGDDPTHDLETVQALVRLKRYVPTRTVLDCLLELGLDESDVEACVLNLRREDFHKSMESKTLPGQWQDVYRPEYCGMHLYLKLQISRQRSAEELVVVISFKRK